MVKEGMMLAERYEIISKVGAGGMSDVYKAMDHKLNRFVAVKILKHEFSENKNFVAKFRTEAQSAAGLVHPNIVNVYDVGEEYGLYYIVMEFVEGITLKHYIEKKLRLSVKEAISIAIQVSMGLETAHMNHVIHRDVKPQNIIISKEGKVKVTDFGIARAATSDTITSNVMGSVHYTSPEQARGGYSDEKSDIYSLGIVLFEMVTGRVPFDGETTVAIAIKQIQEPIPDPRVYVDDVPVSVQQIIYKCCEKNPDRRYTSMTDLITDLKKSLVSPDENFVQRIPMGGLNGATKMVTERETKDIRRGTGSIDLNEDILKAYSSKRKDRYDRDDEPDEDEYDDEEPVRKRKKARKDEPDRKKKAARSRRAAEEEESRKARRAVNKRSRFEDDDDEDDDDDDMDPRLQKIMTVLGVVAALIIVVIIIVLIGKIKGLTSKSSDKLTDPTEATEQGAKVTLKDVTGLVFADAKTQLTAQGFVVTSENVPSDSVEKGKVISVADEDGNTLQAGTEIPSGSTVILAVSSGSEGSAIPDVTGLSKAEAKVAIEAAGFNMKETEAASDTVAEGKVISQSPDAGTSAGSGSDVTVVISTGKAAASKTVPNLVGLTEIAAKAALAATDISFGEVTEEYSSTIAAGIVISQTPTSGTTVDGNTTVSFVVSKGAAKYGGTFSISAPPEYVQGTAATLTVTSSVDNSVLYNATVSSFPAAITISGTTAPSGVLTVNYTVTQTGNAYEDDNGNIVQDTTTVPKSVNQTLTFTAE